ncbi:MAG: FadR family transcriptional regulator [Rhodospirillales bacterium]|nr:MAG: FadR family transcriptional regulator [Rhodospirillales bacterium]
MSQHAVDRTLALMRQMIEAGDYPLNSRLPPERDLCDRLGVTRNTLRRALSTLESEGQIWRHVGKGTFVGTPPNGALDDLSQVTSRTNPTEVMQARQMVEPELARLAALNASATDIEEMRHCIQRTKSARNWRTYEMWDNRLHRAIAKAGGNGCMLAVFDMLNTIRRAVTWGRLRRYDLTPDHSHHSFAEHDSLVDAIEHRDTDLAANLMREHLREVRRDLLQAMPGRD